MQARSVVLEMNIVVRLITLSAVSAFSVAVKSNFSRLEPYQIEQRQFIIFEDGVHLINSQQRAIDVHVNLSDVTIFLYTRANPFVGLEINLGNFTGVIHSDYFKPHRMNFFSAHGYTGDYLAGNNIDLRDAILTKYDANIFLIDWSKHSKAFYSVAVKAALQVGDIVGGCIKKMTRVYQIPYSRISLTGNSLGAHVIGSTGAYLGGKANYILATDPAMPLFNHSDTSRRLDTTDAQFVQVVHTNAGLYGFRNSIGHADYFPNGGGMNQPGCGTDILGMCAHERASRFYTESILTSQFIAKLCRSYEYYKNGSCEHNKRATMGGFYPDRSHGNFYLDTAESSPFGLG